MKPKKLIRSRIPEVLKPGEWETITDIAELNKLYVLKVKEELQEIISSDFSDVNEFADLLDAVMAFAKVNGYRANKLIAVLDKKIEEKGWFDNLALNNLNPNNPSNALYFQDAGEPSKEQA